MGDGKENYTFFINQNAEKVLNEYRGSRKSNIKEGKISYVDQNDEAKTKTSQFYATEDSNKNVFDLRKQESEKVQTLIDLNHKTIHSDESSEHVSIAMMVNGSKDEAASDLYQKSIKLLTSKNIK